MEVLAGESLSELHRVEALGLGLALAELLLGFILGTGLLGLLCLGLLLLVLVLDELALEEFFVFLVENAVAALEEVGLMVVELAHFGVEHGVNDVGVSETLGNEGLLGIVEHAELEDGAFEDLGVESVFKKRGVG